MTMNRPRRLSYSWLDAVCYLVALFLLLPLLFHLVEILASIE